ncbi:MULTISPECIES: glutathione S-transferase family protein [unclassified Sphingomonas]|uniref:glutathione S-transferase family protein n=1 Tax=unclassified Sphingomonas TaxID=196159 RepID=UPI0006F8359C|nr:MULTISPECIES: glutathione S-transferase N-terminal domain-containing protein [unclassified Sphingomonas]KQX25122.1 glutathione S-transferase [Sphingomonas sp. Root1294]KQY66139.1 glutathione S-transferase [Sphingomonas sp. Root50]KRB89695.1 glutathione S-transferase [Sphingomonas sp. Root720]
MKLHWSPSAPFVRKVMVAAHALGLADRIDCVRSRVGPARLNAELMADNPLNKVPTLVLADGTVLYDSRVICDYLDAVAGGGILVPAEPAARWRALRWQCLADGLVDVAILLRDEHFRGEGHRSTAHLAAYTTKMRAGLDAMDAEVEALDDARLNVGSIAIGVALAYMDFRAPGLEWRAGRPRLAAWERVFAEQPAMRAAPFVDEGGKKFAFYAME